jgi:hypothetical protein
MPVISATEKEKSRRIAVQAHSGKKVTETPSSTKKAVITYL